MRLTLLALCFLIPLASARLTARQSSALDDPCIDPCAAEEAEQFALTGCDEDDGVCICLDEGYYTWQYTCLDEHCPAAKADQILTEIEKSCIAILDEEDPTLSSSASRASSSAPVSRSSVAPIGTTTQPAPVSTTTTRPAAPTIPTGVPAVFSSGGSFVPAAETSTSSAAWAMPTAIPGVMGVLAIAAGGLLA